MGTVGRPGYLVPGSRVLGEHALDRPVVATQDGEPEPRGRTGDLVERRNGRGEALAVGRPREVEDASIIGSDPARFRVVKRDRPERVSRLIGTLDETLEDWERRLILDALREASGVQARAAKLLGVSERSLWYRVKKLGIQVRTELA